MTSTEHTEQKNSPIDVRASTASQGVTHAGFWVRAVANTLDTIILSVSMFLLTFGWTVFINPGEEFTAADGVFTVAMYILYFTYSIAFWVIKGATPGKMALGLRVQHAESGENLTVGESVIRVIGYLVSAIIFYLGFIWAAFDPRKQGWHDKMATSVVVVKR